MPDSNGNLISVFEEEIKETMIERRHCAKRICEGYEYSISASLEEKITGMPGLIDWIMSTVLTEERHILINSHWAL
jgi:hypothetical protein